MTTSDGNFEPILVGYIGQNSYLNLSERYIKVIHIDTMKVIK